MPHLCYNFSYQVRYGTGNSWRCDMGEFGDKVEGEVKEKGGQLTGDKKTEWEGKAQGMKGDIEGAGRKLDEKKAEETDKPV